MATLEYDCIVRHPVVYYHIVTHFVVTVLHFVPLLHFVPPPPPLLHVVILLLRLVALCPSGLTLTAISHGDRAATCTVARICRLACSSVDVGMVVRVFDS